jgi:crotonobetaine/carnitine-CoA ligase
VRRFVENDIELPDCETGELIVRADSPWTMFSGYHRQYEATAAAWRNGWFHTGDLFKRDANGDFYFVDRRKDAIRRRGENISSFEVESEVLQLPGVQEAAALGVPSEHGEDDVLIAVALKPGAKPDPVAIVHQLRERLPHFMVPRYVRFLPELPKTPTSKVEKYRLRSVGITPDTWDREAAGVRVNREVLR